MHVYFKLAIDKKNTEIYFFAHLETKEEKEAQDKISTFLCLNTMAIVKDTGSQGN